MTKSTPTLSFANTRKLPIQRSTMNFPALSQEFNVGFRAGKISTRPGIGKVALGETETREDQIPRSLLGYARPSNNNWNGQIVPWLFHGTGKQTGSGTGIRSADGELIKKIGARIAHDTRRTVITKLALKLDKFHALYQSNSEVKSILATDQSCAR